MKYNEIILAINNNVPLVWNDPEPIPGNDYTITRIFDIDEEEGVLTLHYNNGQSTAEVFISEIGIKLEFGEPIFYQTNLDEIEGSIIDHVYPHIGRNTMTVADRLGNKQGQCPACNDNRWWLYPKESVIVRQSGKQYIECLNCGYQTHL